MVKLTVIHRVCPALSKTAVGYTDKRKMVEETTATMAVALRGVEAKITVILDGCADYRDIFEKEFAGKPLEIIETAAIGNKATWAKQVEIARKSDTPYVYFSEDDYIYEPDAFSAMLEAIELPGVDAVSPLDHPDRYNGKSELVRAVNIRISKSRHWRESNSTCLTFLAKKAIVETSSDVLLRYSTTGEEGTMWAGLTKDRVFDFPYLLMTFLRFVLGRRPPFGQLVPVCAWRQLGLKLLTCPRYALYSPMPTLAIHLSSASLSPCSEKAAVFES